MVMLFRGAMRVHVLLFDNFVYCANHLGRAPRLPLGERLAQYGRVGPFAGYVCIMLAAIDWLFLQLLQWLRPVDSIDVAEDYPHQPSKAERLADS